ncbi:MAG: transglutaminase domain-containing protein, partial [Thermoplasmatota archaeon]
MRAKSLWIVSLMVTVQLLFLMMPAEGGEYPREISLIDEVLSFESVVLVPPGEDFTVTFDPQSGQLLPKREPPLPGECMEALELVPEWMRLNLTHKFRLLPSGARITFANLIRNSPNSSYRDEIGFAIAHSTPETLTDGNFFPQLLTHNARLIYEYDEYLDYVEIVERDDFTTLSYRQSDGSWLELPRDDYYWFVVHPKLGDELPTYVDPDYNYTTDPPFDRNHGVAPPEGKFWREWFFEYNKTGKPLLLDRLKGMNTTLDAIKAINGWIGASMIFTSDNERPVQPVRIYVKGKGRCGEYQDMRSAAARAALIPVIATSNAAEDHVWNEFWDVTWHHWDGMIDNPRAYEKGWGKTLSSVWNSRGDGYSWSVTSTYSETATINALVRDLAGLPVDGAEIGIYTENFYQPEVRTETFGTATDSNGRVSIELGDLRNYWGRADTADLGSDPTNPLTQNEIAMNVSAGEEYGAIFRLPQSAPRLQSLPTGNRPVPAGPNDPFFNIDFEVIGQITRGDARIAPGRYDLYKNGGNIDFFISDRANTAAYNNDAPFMGYYVRERTSNFTLQIKVSSDDQWTYVLSNKFSQQTYKVIRMKVSVETDTYLNIETPVEGQRISFGEVFEISGVVRTSLVEPRVEISMNTWVDWHECIVRQDENGTYRYSAMIILTFPYKSPYYPTLP